MRIEAVITCVNYGDFLAATLPLNKTLFDRLVVVTTPDDLETQKLCEWHHVEVLATPAFGTDRGEFCKGCAINAGLQRLQLDGWTVHLDADIALPPQTRQLLQNANLNPTMLYGIDRHNIVGARAWARQLARPKLQQEASVYVHAEAFPVATRFMSPRHGGYLPIGFFQLWHPAATGIRRYPELHSTAGRTDMLFAAQWPRAGRSLIPEIIGYHLESEQAPQGANWSGRTTRRFEVATWRQRTPCAAWRRWRKRHRHPPQPHPYALWGASK